MPTAKVPIKFVKAAIERMKSPRGAEMPLADDAAVIANLLQRRRQSLL